MDFFLVTPCTPRGFGFLFRHHHTLNQAQAVFRIEAHEWRRFSFLLRYPGRRMPFPHEERIPRGSVTKAWFALWSPKARTDMERMDGRTDGNFAFTDRTFIWVFFSRDTRAKQGFRTGEPGSGSLGTFRVICMDGVAFHQVRDSELLASRAFYISFHLRARERGSGKMQAWIYPSFAILPGCIQQPG